VEEGDGEGVKQDFYSEKWRDLNKRTILFWMLFIAFFPATYFGAKIFPQVDPVWIGTACATPWIMAIYYRGLFQCPRCNKLFFVTDSWQNGVTQHCLHCRLPRGGGPND
jgi:hypothetical protein